MSEEENDNIDKESYVPVPDKLWGTRVLAHEKEDGTYETLEPESIGMNSYEFHEESDREDIRDAVKENLYPSEEGPNQGVVLLQKIDIGVSKGQQIEDYLAEKGIDMDKLKSAVAE